MVRAIFVCKGLLFQAVHITGERRKEEGQRQSLCPLLQPAGLEGSVPVPVLRPISRFQMTLLLC